MSAGIEVPRDDVNRLQRTALLVALLAGAAAAVGAFTTEPGQFWRSYLLAFMFTLAIPLGSFAVVQIFHLTHGAWGFGSRRFLEGATRTLPFLALAFAPLAFFGMHSLYEWSHPGFFDAADHRLDFKRLYYLTPQSFQSRAVLYFALWIGLALVQSANSRRLDATGDVRILKRMSMFAGPSLVLYVLTMSFAAFDWTMSLDAHWFSTIYGAIFVVGQGVSAWAFAIVFSNWLRKRPQFEWVMTPGHFHDLGKLMFAFVLLHAYTNFSQFLIIWAGNVAEEQPFFQLRKTGPWLAIGLFLVVFHFTLPFLVLLSRNLKRNAAKLVIVAVWLIALRWVDLTWYIVPSVRLGSGSIGRLHWLDVALPLALFSLWFALFLQTLKGRAVVDTRDLEYEAELEGVPLTATHH